MKPEIENALKTIDAACATFKGTRQDHVILIECIATIRKELETQAESGTAEAKGKQ